jgi:hypothetical protein
MTHDTVAPQQLLVLLNDYVDQHASLWSARMARTNSAAVDGSTVNTLRGVENVHAAAIVECQTRIDELAAFAETLLSSGAMPIGEVDETGRAFRTAAGRACAQPIQQIRKEDGTSRGLLRKANPDPAIDRVEAHIAQRAAETALSAVRRKREHHHNDALLNASVAQVAAGDAAKKAAHWQIAAAIIAGLSLLVTLWPAIKDRLKSWFF